MHKTFNDTYFTSMDEPLSIDIDLDMFPSTAQNINNNNASSPQNYTTTNQHFLMDNNITDFENDNDDDSMLLNDLDDFKSFMQDNDDNNRFITAESSISPDMKYNSSMAAGMEQLPQAHFPEQEELEGYTLIKQIGEGAFAKVFKAIPNKNAINRIY